MAFRPSLIVNALGPPPQHMIDRCKEEGRLVGALAGKAVHAERHVKAGVDIIIGRAPRPEATPARSAPWFSIPEIVDAVAPVPVLGAGGIGRAARWPQPWRSGPLVFGAVGLAHHRRSRNTSGRQAKMLKATSDDTLRSRSRTGKHARMLRSAWTDE
ncbi:MAG: hypothetical protein R2706_03175 [Acidimicrobiales bacterium]